MEKLVYLSMGCVILLTIFQIAASIRKYYCYVGIDEVLEEMQEMRDEIELIQSDHKKFAKEVFSWCNAQSEKNVAWKGAVNEKIDTAIANQIKIDGWICDFDIRLERIQGILKPSKIEGRRAFVKGDLVMHKSISFPLFVDEVDTVNEYVTCLMPPEKLGDEMVKKSFKFTELIFCINQPMKVDDLSEVANKYLSDKVRSFTQMKDTTETLEDGTEIHAQYIQVVGSGTLTEETLKAFCEKINSLAELGAIEERMLSRVSKLNLMNDRYLLFYFAGSRFYLQELKEKFGHIFCEEGVVSNVNASDLTMKPYVEKEELSEHTIGQNGVRWDKVNRKIVAEEIQEKVAVGLNNGGEVKRVCVDARINKVTGEATFNNNNFGAGEVIQTEKNLLSGQKTKEAISQHLEKTKEPITKTVREWFEGIEDQELREKCLRNMGLPESHCYCLSHALNTGFNWRTSSEGYEFWNDLKSKLEKKGK